MARHEPWDMTSGISHLNHPSEVDDRAIGTIFHQHVLSLSSDFLMLIPGCQGPEGRKNW
jgi:hypothetical protein